MQKNLRNGYNCCFKASRLLICSSRATFKSHCSPHADFKKPLKTERGLRRICQNSKPIYNFKKLGAFLWTVATAFFRGGGGHEEGSDVQYHFTRAGVSLWGEELHVAGAGLQKINGIQCVQFVRRGMLYLVCKCLWHDSPGPLPWEPPPFPTPEPDLLDDFVIQPRSG